MSRTAWRNSCRLGRFQMLQSGATSKRSVLAASAITFGREQAERESASSPADIPANRSRPLAVELDEKIRDTFGPGLLTRLRSIGRIYAFSRTCRDISLWGSERSEKTWSRWVTRLRRACLRRRKSALRTSANGFSSSQWPTAKASTGGADPLESEGHQGGVPLVAQAVSHWPTPRASMTENGSDSGSAQRRETGPNPGLKDAAALWCTPGAMGGGSVSRSGDRIDEPLLAGQAVRHSLPAPETPTPGDSSSTAGPTSHPQPKRRLNPLFVEWMMGWPGQWSIASTACGPAEMESFLSQQRAHLSSYLLRL